MISEAASKKKRGRPKIFSDDLYVMLFNDNGRRQNLNNCYASVAIGSLMNGNGNEIEKQFHWLSDGGKHGRMGILAELGRIGDREIIRTFAKALCQNKPKSKDAIADIRRWRLGKEKSSGSRLQLMGELERVIDSYGIRHRAMATHEIYEALMELAHSFREQAEREGYEATA